MHKQVPVGYESLKLTPRQQQPQKGSGDIVFTSALDLLQVTKPSYLKSDNMCQETHTTSRAANGKLSQRNARHGDGRPCAGPEEEVGRQGGRQSEVINDRRVVGLLMLCLATCALRFESCHP